MTDINVQQQLAIRTVTPLAVEANALKDTVEAFEIVDDETCATFADLRKQCMLRLKKVKDAKAKMRKPIADGLKEIDSFFKPAIDHLDGAINASKTKLDAWARAQHQIEQERKRVEREQAEAERLRNEAEANELRSMGAGETAEAIEAAAEKRVVEASKPVKIEATRGQVATVVTVKTWKAHVYSVKELCKAVGAGQLPADCVDVKQSVLDGLARAIAAEQEKHGFTVYEHISTVTK